MARIFEVPKIDYRFCREVLAPHGLRRKMWVGFENRPGVITGVLPDGHVQVMLVTDDCRNLMEVIVPPWQLKRAKRKQIPESRRPDVDRGLRLGYV